MNIWQRSIDCVACCHFIEQNSMLAYISQTCNSLIQVAFNDSVKLMIYIYTYIFRFYTTGTLEKVEALHL